MPSLTLIASQAVPAADLLIAQDAQGRAILAGPDDLVLGWSSGAAAAGSPLVVELLGGGLVPVTCDSAPALGQIVEQSLNGRARPYQNGRRIGPLVWTPPNAAAGSVARALWQGPAVMKHAAAADPNGAINGDFAGQLYCQAADGQLRGVWIFTGAPGQSSGWITFP